MASTFVEITREDFEDWLNQSPFRWKRDPRYAGIYILILSKHVGISIRSTVGGSGQAKGKGSASGAMRLVSLEHGHTLNSKDMGQSHFARTTNWRVNWKKGVNSLIDAYDRSPSFYDAFAGVPDRDVYKKHTLAVITSIPNWAQDVMLSSYQDQVSRGGILTEKQQELLADKVRHPLEPEKPKAPPVEDERLQDLRKLWLAAKHAGDQWLMDFAKSIGDQLKAGRPLTPKQVEAVKRNLDKHRLASAGRVAQSWLASVR